jgi:thiol-disulfide isomerase/thioredoxin
MSSARAALISILFLTWANPGFAADPPLQVSLVPYQPRVKAPQLMLANQDGRQFSLEKLKGKVVVINYWATWCPPCRREFPSMEKLRGKMSGKPVEVLAVNEGEDTDVIDTFLSTLDTQPGFPILLDIDGEAMGNWPVRGLPTTFIIDKRGRMAYRAIGGRDFDHPDIVKRITQLLRER